MIVVKNSKKPAERRNEFIAIAEELFLEKGFENTTVDDIVGRMGVAKGLFYYYFDSKEDLLASILERLIDEIQSSISAAMERQGLTAVERFIDLLPSNTDISSRSMTLIAYFHKERNQAFHHLMEKRSREFMIPAVELIIRQGNGEGVFNVRYPKETAVAVVAIIASLKEHNPSVTSPEQTLRLMEVAQDLVERILGAKMGTLDVLKDHIPPMFGKEGCGPSDGKTVL